MALTFLDAIDFTKIPALQFVVPVVANDPAGYEAGFIYNSTSKEVKYHNGTSWVALGPSGAGGPPTGAAGGDLSGSYPNPTIAAGVIVDADVNASAAIAQSKIANLTTDLAARVLKAGDTMTGFLTLNADPTSALHAATKQYVDLAAQGFDFKDACRVVATSNTALSGLLTIDGVTLVANDRVLVANNTTASQNGIYLAASGSWTRALDMDASGELVDGTLVSVGAGTTNADTLWLCTATGATPWVPGSSTSTWSKFSSITDLVAGAGLTKTGSTLDVVAATTELTVNADSITINSAPKWTTARTISLTGAVTGGPTSIDGTANISIATSVDAPKAYNADIGGSTSVAVTHNLNTLDVAVALKVKATGAAVMAGWTANTVNQITVTFASAPAASSIRCSVLAAA